jgi:hypothetical protein
MNHYVPHYYVAMVVAGRPSVVVTAAVEQRHSFSAVGTVVRHRWCLWWNCYYWYGHHQSHPIAM